MAEVQQKFAPFEAKMRAEGLSDAAIAAFRHSYAALVSGATGLIAEADISPVETLPDLEADIRPSVQADPSLLKSTVVLKLNGGLGTSMGLDKAKSLLTVKQNKNFLDFTALQIIGMRKKFQQNVRFMLMNSFNTSNDTLQFLAKYPQLLDQPNLELMQNKVPKVNAKTLEPAEWSTNRNLEWCPPGHGDLYTAMLGSGVLDQLLDEGFRYMFVSNSDNLGATLDLDLLSYFASSDKPFLMECCRRTESDKKGGHLAVRRDDSQLILRESAQCPDADEASFQDVSRHQFFNTNNLWIRLDRLKELMTQQGGFIALPMIKNKKTVDPKDTASFEVFQLETAMGAAIECFPGAGAVIVPRERFAPVKKCSDLLLLRSDAYVINDEHIPVVNQECTSVPVIDLDGKRFKLVTQLEEATRDGNPSLVGCTRLVVKGEVIFSSRVILEGSVTIVNSSNEPKVVPPGVYRDTTVDLTDAPGLGVLRTSAVATMPYPGQKPGTSGLRKKTATFMEGYYLHNFVQATFDALAAQGTDVSIGTLLVGGDGRYFNDRAIQIIIKMAIANGVRRIWVAKDGLCSTPGISALIRERGPVWQKAFGAFILTASHNPGGPQEDFGIKYNCENGGPAPERLTDAIYELTTTITSFKICEEIPPVDISKLGVQSFATSDGSRSVQVEVVDGISSHVQLLKTIFDFDALRALFKRPDFSFVYDSMSGVQGPYARRVFVEELGAPESCLINDTPKDDFGGGHADPNLTYARQVCDVMGVDRTGMPITGQTSEPPCLGAAADGDADRNMILGRRFFVTPSDSLAIICAYADVIPYFRQQGGLKAVARSMPTSGAVDLVAKRLNLSLFEAPTGWKFFGNLMDSRQISGENFCPLICGEESFGTGSDHVREKDGLWAVLAWLSILAHHNSDPQKPFVHVEEIVRAHWNSYGRNFYCRYDYEGVGKSAAEGMMSALEASFNDLPGRTYGSFTVAHADQFEYHDPVDGSVSRKQGVRILFTDGSRVVFRLSGTAGSGATVRMYLEKYEPKDGNVSQQTGEALQELVNVALEISRLAEHTGRNEPTVIT